MEPDAVCIANIGPRERRKRLVFGAVSLALSTVIAAALVLRGVPVAWRVGLFVPLLGASLGFFQWQTRT
jgi:hypothetical protein